MQLTPGFHALLLQFRSVFTAPTFATSLSIATGWCLTHRHRYVTQLIPAPGATRRGHHSRYHRYFSTPAWSIDDLYEGLARRAVATFFPDGTIINGHRRHARPQARPGHLRHGHAPRPADLQPRRPHVS